MTTNTSRELAQRFIDALTAFEREGEPALEPLVALFADDAYVTNPTLASIGEARVGRDEVRRFWETYRGVLGTCRSRFFYVTTGDEAAGLFWTTRSEQGGIEYSGATLLVFDEDGKISWFQAHFSLEELERSRARAHAREEPAEATRDERDNAPVHDTVPDSAVSYG